jgi:tetratricopeptide (TPR) repeat protein
MLTDLRDRLKGVGRLDVLTSVNQRALAYYAGQDLNSLSATSLERRARILHAMGQDDEARGNLNRALAQFQEAARTTAALLAERPDDVDRIFTHAQSEFWVGTIDLERGRVDRAKFAFERYKMLAERLLQREPQNAKWLQEAGYAEGNLCSVALTEPLDKEAALRACQVALQRMEEAARRVPDPSSMDGDLANRHAWLADAWFRNDRADLSLSHRKIQERILSAMLARDPRNMDVRDQWVTNQMSLAGLEAWNGDLPAGKARLTRALSTVDNLVHLDPSNSDWLRRREDVLKKLSNLKTRH